MAFLLDHLNFVHDGVGWSGLSCAGSRYQTSHIRLNRNSFQELGKTGHPLSLAIGGVSQKCDTILLSVQRNPRVLWERPDEPERQFLQIREIYGHQL